MITPQTFDFKDNRDELAAIAEALDCLRLKKYTEAAQVLIRRHEILTEKPKLKPYDPRETRV